MFARHMPRYLRTKILRYFIFSCLVTPYYRIFVNLKYSKIEHLKRQILFIYFLNYPVLQYLLGYRKNGIITERALHSIFKHETIFQLGNQNPPRVIWVLKNVYEDKLTSFSSYNIWIPFRRQGSNKAIEVVPPGNGMGPWSGTN